tara:strand:+ start:1359 stop:1760 length:402 start_codon:yes stop_codon:yes gene_type:complete
MQINKKYHFYAAHRNKNADEKCGRIHGHEYRVRCTFETGKQNEKTGISILFGDIDNLVEPIIKDYCHWFLLYEKDSLCQVLDLANEPYKPLPFETSAENLVLWLYTRIVNETKLPLTRIELQETNSSTVIYEP